MGGAIGGGTGGGMRHDGPLDEPLLLAQCWQYWAERCAQLSPEEWATPTRCPPWDVAALVAHVAPDPAMLEGLAARALDDDAAVADPSLLLREFNRPGMAAEAMAGEVARRAVEKAADADPVALVRRFVDGGGIVLREPGLPPSTVVPHPGGGTVTVGVLTAIAIVEATVHYLDLIDA